MTDQWQPISEGSVLDKTNEAWPRMNFEQRRLWEIIKIVPEKWSQQKNHHSHGSWVVAIVGRMLIWYDDIEDGFRQSLWTKYGVIDNDFSNIELRLEEQLAIISTYFNTSLSGPPSEYFR